MNSGPERSPARLKVGLVGAGARVSEIYVPILQRLSERYEIIGFTTRSSSTSNRFKEKTGVRPFQDAATMVTSEQPDFLVAAVASDANVRTLERLIDLKIPVLAET